ncbi:MAG: hypothetical protein WCP36_03840 [Methanomicrobiales archaeon]
MRLSELPDTLSPESYWPSPDIVAWSSFLMMMVRLEGSLRNDTSDPGLVVKA